jgi:uncharacterized LabA/DUF88 family protein
MIDQNSQFFAILTNIGVAKQANADALGIPWKITQMGVGDANGTDPIPSATQTKLINERRRAPLNQLKVDPANAAIIVAEQVIPENVGGWWIREISLYDSDGDMVAVANCAPSFKPLLTQGSGRTQVVRMNMIVSNSSNVELKIDPSVVLATRAYVDSKVMEELHKLDSKQSVRVATTANIALTGLQTIDTIALAAGDRVLVKNQTAAKDNGLYVVAAGAWSRASDADHNSEVTSALLVSIEQGATQADTRWQLVTDGAIILGTTVLTFHNVTKGFAPINSPAFTGNPTAPTTAVSDNDTSIATTAFVHALAAFYGMDGVSKSTGAITSLNSVTANGLFYNTAILAEGADKPPGSMTGYLLVMNHSTAGAPYIFQQWVASTGTELLVCHRRCIDKVWEAWRVQAFTDSPVFTGNPRAPTPETGDNDTSVATTAFVQAAMNGSVTVSIAGTGSITLTAAQAGAAIINLTGALTGNRTVVVPTAVGRYQIRNNTTGNFTVTVKTAAGAGQLITRGMSSLMFCDGAAVHLQQTDFISPVLRGTPTAPLVPRFNSTGQIITGEALKARGHQFAGMTSIVNSLAGVIEHVGGIVHCSSGVGTYSLPNGGTLKLPSGATVRIQNWSTAPLSITVQGADKIQENIATLPSNAKRTIPADTYVDAIYIDSGVWLLSGTGVTGQSQQFGALLSPQGYQRLPSGYIEQWGVVTTTVFNGGFNAFNFPVSFTKLVCMMMASPSAKPSGYVGCEATSLGSGVLTSSSVNYQVIYWRAIGV